MNYEALQTDIATRLGELNPNPAAPVADIVVLPENEVDYKRAAHERPRVTVAYTGSEFGAGNSDFNSFDIGDVGQDEIIQLEIHIQAKRLYGATGLYPVLHAMQPLLLGYRPANCDKIHFKRSQLQQTADGLFLFVLSCIVKTYAVEAATPSTAPLVTQVSYNGL